jgi:2-polyprenyl-3-methyl-5-hydroxy-6-metoxy-1,4-benzoquinol methylase
MTEHGTDMTTAPPAPIKNDRPWEKPWPKEGLETLGECPVCGDMDRHILHSDLVDNVFFCAPGVWKLWQCVKCRSAYLDPRPTPETIGLAYKQYYTHGTTGSSKVNYANLGVIQKARRQLVNGYTKRRFGSPDRPANEIGYFLSFLIPWVKNVPDRYFRHIPSPKSGSNKLLDVGCGDGSFLLLAKSCGWEVCGVDPDEAAVTSAIKKGLDVYQGGAEHFRDQKEVFDVITLSHVIEHVHSPKKTIGNCYDLLKPGGTIWIETPNIDSYGHQEFGKNWRGLETPRHLTILNRRALHDILQQTGFDLVKDVGKPSPNSWTYKASLAISKGLSPYSSIPVPWRVKYKAKAASLFGNLQPWRREFLTLTAKKPD